MSRADGKRQGTGPSEMKAAGAPNSACPGRPGDTSIDDRGPPVEGEHALLPNQLAVQRYAARMNEGGARE